MKYWGKWRNIVEEKKPVYKTKRNRKVSIVTKQEKKLGLIQKFHNLTKINLFLYIDATMSALEGSFVLDTILFGEQFSQNMSTKDYIEKTYGQEAVQILIQLMEA